MVRRTLAERLAQSEAKVEKLRAQAKTEARVRDTRRKVLAGALLLHLASEAERDGAAARDLIRRRLAGFLTRPDDKELFADQLATSAPDEPPATDDAELPARESAL